MYWWEDTRAWLVWFRCGGPSVFFPKGYMPNLDDWSGCYAKGTVRAAMALVEQITMINEMYESKIE